MRGFAAHVGRRSVLIVGLVCFLMSGVDVRAEDSTTASASEDSREQKIRDLWAELQGLLSGLPEARRQELWLELQGLSISEMPFETPAGDAETAVAEIQPSESKPEGQPQDLNPDSVVTPSGRGCNTLQPFDTDNDQKLTGLDRHWRHFYLWLDRNGDGRMDDRELEPPYEKGVRQISVHLRSFVRGKKKRARELQILDEQYLLLDLDGDGWQGLAPSSNDGALAVNVDAVREAGGPVLQGPDGAALQGIVAFRPGWRFLEADGEATGIRCPRN